MRDLRYLGTNGGYIRFLVNGNTYFADCIDHQIHLGVPDEDAVILLATNLWEILPEGEGALPPVTKPTPAQFVDTNVDEESRKGQSVTELAFYNRIRRRVDQYKSPSNE